MLKLTPEALAKEVTNGFAYLKKHLVKVQQIEQRYVGNWFSNDWSTEPTPENIIFSFLAQMLPEICHANPSPKVQPRRVWTHKDIADFMKVGLDTWITETQPIHEMRDIARDAIFGWGVGMIGMEDRDHGDRPPRLDAINAMRPFLQHLPRHKFFMDPRAKKPGDCRIAGHKYEVDAEDLASYPYFDQAAVATLSGAGGDPARDDNKDKPAPTPESDRGEVQLVDVWVRDQNVICTLAWAAGMVQPVFVRPPTPYEGPPGGPYRVLGFYSVPNDPYPMGPIQPAMEQIEELQAHARAASEEAASFKNLTFVDAAQPEVFDAVKGGENNWVYAIKGFNPQSVTNLPIGQVHPQRMEQIMVLRERTDRVMGMGDNQRGRAVNSTASESQIVQANSDVRISHLREKIEQFAHEVLRGIGHFLFYSPLVVMPVAKTDPMTGTADEGTFYGGQTDGQEGVEWIDFYLEIQPQSMSRNDDQVLQQLWVQCMTLAVQAAQGMATMPFINWRFMFEQWGNTWNQPRLADVVFNPAAMAAFSQDPRLFGMGLPVPVPGDVNAQIPGNGLGLPALPATGPQRRPPAQGGAGAAAPAAPAQRSQRSPRLAGAA